MNPPLAVIRYLAELDAALAGRHAPDRDQIVTQIGEHITEALRDTPEPSDAEIAAVLAELGDPLRIADEAAGAARPPDRREGASLATSPRTEPGVSTTSGASVPRPPVVPAPGPPVVPLLRRPWIPKVTASLWVVGVLWPLLLTSWNRLDAVGNETIHAAVALVATNIPLVASIVLVLCSPLYRPSGRVLWTMLSPLVVFATLFVSRVSLYHRDVPWIVNAVCAALTTSGALAVVVITRRARDRVILGAGSEVAPPCGVPSEGAVT